MVVVWFNAVEHAGRGVTTTFKEHVTRMANSAATHRFAFRRTIILFFQQDNEPKHTSRLYSDCSTNKESDGVVRHMTRLPLLPEPKSQLRRFGLSQTAGQRKNSQKVLRGPQGTPSRLVENRSR